MSSNGLWLLCSAVSVVAVELYCSMFTSGLFGKTSSKTFVVRFFVMEFFCPVSMADYYLSMNATNYVALYMCLWYPRDRLLQERGCI